MSEVVEVKYTNWKDQTSLRKIEPIKIFFGRSEHHTDDQWLLKCFDVDKNVERTFAMRDIHSWN